jgi:hypothetical protein
LSQLHPSQSPSTWETVENDTFSNSFMPPVSRLRWWPAIIIQKGNIPARHQSRLIWILFWHTIGYFWSLDSLSPHY